MSKLTPHPFEPPQDDDLPKEFIGFLVVGFAGGCWFSGCDTDSSLDAYRRMKEVARAELLPAVKVGEKLDVSFPRHLVKSFRVEADE